jgi:hypothetical protein
VTIITGPIGTSNDAAGIIGFLLTALPNWTGRLPIRGGCTRVENPRDRAAWVLEETPGWSRREIDAAIAKGQKVYVRVARKIPVAWVYLTGWATRDGTIHFLVQANRAQTERQITPLNSALQRRLDRLHPAA